MKRILLTVLAAIVILSQCAVVCAAEGESAEPSYYTELFKKDGVIDINIQIDEKDLEDMYAYPKNEEYHSADITVAGIEIKNSGIRTKGNMTLSSVASSDSDRYSFRIKFNKYVKGQKLLGLNELCLNNEYSDPSYMREYLHYELLREMGQKVPETVFCNLYINGELYGFYLAVEAIDDSFLERNYGENQNGNLYKMEEGASLIYNEEETYSYGELKSGSDKEREGLKSLIKKLDSGDKDEIESVLDVDSALIYIAANTVLCSYDSYNNSMKHNYYLYQNGDGIFSVLTWDVNMSFGGRESNTNVGIDTPLVSGSMEDAPLISKLLAIDEYKDRYYGYIKDMMAWLEKLEGRVNEIKAIIKPYVEADPSAFYTPEEFEKATTLTEETTEAEPAENKAEGFGKGRGFGGGKSILNLMKERYDNLKAQFEGIASKSTEPGDSMGFGGMGRGKGDFKMQGGVNPGEFPGGAKMPGFDGDMPEDMPQMGGERRGGNPPEGFDGKMPEGFEEKIPEVGKGKGGMFGSKAENTFIRVHADGHIVSFETEPVLKNDTTLVGFRAILEALGAEVTWDEEAKTVTAVKDDTNILLKIGSDTAYVNGEEVKLLAAPEIIGNATMIPVRFVSENMGMKVSWDGDTKLITISSK
ncbi:MAG: CotH kinase family protein [Clostridia bacterium]|nr:CotH kinase family protein [Clostridia bacterium]